MLMRDMRRKGGKLDPKWVGPYTIVKTLGKGFYSLKSIATPISIIKRVNGSQLKPFLSSSNLPSDTHSFLHDEDESLVHTHSKSDNQTLPLSSPVSSIKVTCATAPTDSGQELQFMSTNNNHSGNQLFLCTDLQYQKDKSLIQSFPHKTTLPLQSPKPTKSPALNQTFVVKSDVHSICTSYKGSTITSIGELLCSTLKMQDGYIPQFFSDEDWQPSPILQGSKVVRFSDYLESPQTSNQNFNMCIKSSPEYPQFQSAANSDTLLTVAVEKVQMNLTN